MLSVGIDVCEVLLADIKDIGEHQEHRQTPIADRVFSGLPAPP
jgi:hypothetical protein